MMEQANDPFQLLELRKVLKAKGESKILGTEKENNELRDGIEAALELVTKIENQLTMEAKTMEAAFITFEDENIKVKKAFLLVLDNLFSENSKVRSACYRFFDQVHKPPSSIDFLSNELISKLTGKDGIYNAWMTSEIRKGNEDALKTWNILIRMMGKAIHQTGPGVQVLNSLLQIVEHAFKSSSQELRKSGYLCWRVLIDNFALDPQVLSSSKRIKLITRPLVGAIGNKSEGQIVAKFDTWWYYICLLNEKLCDHIDTVVIPFLTFCYSSVPVTSATGTHQSPPMGLQSPAKRYSSIRTRCLEATAVLLGGLNNVRVTKLNITNLRTLTEGVLKPGPYVKHHKFFLWCLEEAFGMLDIKDRAEINYFITIYQSIVQYTEKIGNTPTYQHQDYASTFRPPVSRFFHTVEKMLSTVDCSEQGVGLAQSILQELKRLPIHMIISPKSWSKESERKHPPLTMLLQLMLKKEFIHIAYLQKTSNIKDMYLSLFEKFTSIAAGSKDYGLEVLNVTLNTIKEESGTLLQISSKFRSETDTNPSVDGSEIDRKTAIANLWKIVAGAFKTNIDRYSEVNQSKTSSLDHDLEACKTVLLHPFQVFPDVTAKVIWNKWADLYRQINMLAALVVTYKTLELERYLSKEGTKLFICLTPPMAMNCFANFCLHLSQQMVSSIPYPTIQSHESTSAAESSMQEIKPIIGLLVSLCKEAQGFDPKYKRLCITGCSSLCLQLTNLLANINNRRIVRPLLKQVTPALVALLCLHPILGHGFEKLVKDVYEQAINQIQTRYDGSFTLDFLTELMPFLKSALSHGNRDIRSRAHQMWQLTFGNTIKEENIPAEIADLLKNHSGVLFDSSVSSSQVQDSNRIQTENIAANPILTFESFFDKRHSTGLVKSPLKVSDKTANEKPQTPTSTTKWAKPNASNSSGSKSRGRKIFLEDESSQDFVKISSPKVKKRPLTDHQKDILTSRRDDIPALYSELSRDDSQVAPLPDQFQSQNLISSDKCESQVNTKDQTNILDSSMPKVVKAEKEENSQDEDILSTTCSMSIIAPKNAKKLPLSKDDNKDKNCFNERPVSDMSISAKNDDEDSNSVLDVSEGHQSMPECSSPKTSSTRRKLKLPQKNAYALKKPSPGKRRKSKRSIGIATSSSKNIENITSPSTDKENKSYIVSNALTANTSNLVDDSNILPNMINIDKKSQSGRRSSKHSYSPVVKVTPSSKKKLEQHEEQVTKISQRRSEVQLEAIEKENSVLREIGSKLDRIRTTKSPCKSLQEMEQDPLHVSTSNDISVESKVLIEKLSPKNEEITSKSPVKILNEDPLTLVPINESNDPSPVARQINFGHLNVNTDLLKNSDENSQIIDSSQQEGTKKVNLRNKPGNISRKRRISNINGNASKKAKIKVDSPKGGNENDGKMESKELEGSNKRSKRIANRAKNNMTSIKKKSPQKESENVESTNSIKLPDSIDTKTSVEKQPSQKMRLNKYGESPLHVAVKRGDIEKVRNLLSEGADANSKDHAGWRPIHESMREGEDALRIIRLLVDHGADINAQSDSGNTALHDAAAYMSREIIEYLVKSGADPTVKNLDGKNPLDISKMPQYARPKEVWEILSNVHKTSPLNTEKDFHVIEHNSKKVVDPHDVQITLDEVNHSKDGSVSNIIDDNVVEPIFNSGTKITQEGNSPSDRKVDKGTEGSIDLFSSSEKESPKALFQDKIMPTTNLAGNKTELTIPMNGEKCKENVELLVSSNSSDLKEKDRAIEYSESGRIEDSQSDSSVCNKIGSNTVIDKLMSRNSSSEDEVYTEYSHPKMPSNIRTPSVANGAATKRRNSGVSPFGPGSRGARLLEMANKKSKQSSNFSNPANSALNNSFSESNTYAGSNTDNLHGITADAPSSTFSKFALMSPRVENRASLSSPLPALSKQQEKELLSTPTSLHLDTNKSKPWQKFVPSPSGASPTASILKRTESPLPSDNGDNSDSSNGTTIKRRRVKFTDPPVSEQVEIPRSQLTGGPGSGGTSIVGPNKATSMSISSCSSNNTKIIRQEISKGITTESSTDNEKEHASSNNLEHKHSNEITSDNVSEDDEYADIPFIVKSSIEPVSTILTYLTSKTFYKTAQKCLEEKSVDTIADLCNLNMSQVNSLKGLRPPSNILAIKEALKKFEKVLQKREIINMANNALYSNQLTDAPLLPKEALRDKNASKLTTAPFMECSSTPDEEDKALKEIYERPSPSPTEREQDLATENLLDENCKETKCENHEAECEGLESLSLIKETQTNVSETYTESTVNQKTELFSYNSSSKENDLVDLVEKTLETSETTNENSTQQSEIFEYPTQPITSKSNLILEDTVAMEKDTTSNATAIEKEAAENVISRPSTSQTGTQTSQLSKEAQLEDSIKFLQTCDVKTVSDVIGKLHGILQEKISKL